MKKHMIAVLALSLVSTLAFANGNQDSGTGTKKLTSFIAESRPAYPEEGTIIGNKIQEMTGVEVEVEWLVGDLETRAGIMLASGELPDLLNGRNEHYKFRDAGYLIPLEDLIKEHAPNIVARVGKNWDKMFQDGSEGRHIYTIPDLIPYGNATVTRPENAWYIQSIILEEAGWPKIKTMDEFFKLIADYKAKNPQINGRDTIAFQLNMHSWYKWYVLEGAPEVLRGYRDSMIRVTKENGKWVSGLTYDTQEYKEFFEKFNKYYNDGLIGAEGFVNTLDQYKASMANGHVLATYAPEWVIQSSMDALKTDDPKRAYVGLALAWDDSVAITPYNETQTASWSHGTSITTSCKDPVTAIKWLDRLLEDDIQMLGYWGVENVDYYRDENGRVNRTEEQNKLFENRSNDYYYPVWGGEYWVEFFPSINGSFDDGTATRFGSQPEIFFAGLKGRDKEILTNMGWKTFADDFVQPSDPEIADRAAYRFTYNYNAETGSPEHTFAQKMEMQTRPEYLTQLIMAENSAEFNRVWKEYVNAIHSEPGYEEFLKFMQDNVDARSGQNK